MYMYLLDKESKNIYLPVRPFNLMHMQITYML